MRLKEAYDNLRQGEILVVLLDKMHIRVPLDADTNEGWVEVPDLTSVARKCDLSESDKIFRGYAKLEGKKKYGKVVFEAYLKRQGKVTTRTLP